MYLRDFRASHFRNIEQCAFTPHPHINLVYGDNGSGKTSLIEALYFLSLGRSFRAAQLGHILTHGSKAFQLFGALWHERDQRSLSLGIEKTRSGDTVRRLNARPARTQAELTYEFPVQLFHPQGFALLGAGAQARCRLIDWGAFYHYRHFRQAWARARQLLRQRNAALKQGVEDAGIRVWDKALAEAATTLDQLRADYLAELFPVIESMLPEFLEKQHIELTYYRGWSAESSLDQVLERQLPQDRKAGSTQSGPHRADLRIKADGVPAQAVLSRGQHKLLVCAIKLAQGMLFSRTHSSPCIYLIDDLPSELDSSHLQRFIDELARQQAQVFLTAIHADVARQLPAHQAYAMHEGRVCPRH